MFGARRTRVDDTVIIGNVTVLSDELVAALTSSSALVEEAETTSAAATEQRTADVIEQLCVSFGVVRYCKVADAADVEAQDAAAGEGEDGTIAIECAFKDAADAAAAVDSLHGVVLGNSVLSCRYKMLLV